MPGTGFLFLDPGPWDMSPLGCDMSTGLRTCMKHIKRGDKVSDVFIVLPEYLYAMLCLGAMTRDLGTYSVTGDM